MSSPRIGQMVHYRSFGTPKGEYQSACRAAFVTGLYDTPDVVDLAVLNPTGLFFNTASFDSSATNGGTWHWECVAARNELTLPYGERADIGPDDDPVDR